MLGMAEKMWEVDKKLLEEIAILVQAKKEGRNVFFLKKRKSGHTLMMQLLETEDIGYADVIKQNLLENGREATKDRTEPSKLI